MGGSAVGGDLAVDVVGDRAVAPIVTVRDYFLPGWVGEDELVLCASYSGSTEETLACYDAARAARAGRVVLTTGGPLAERARADGVPVIGVPAGMQPRAAVVYMVVAALECAAACGAAPSLADDIEAAAALLEELAAEWGPDAGEDSLAKSLARFLDGTVPVVHGAGATVAAARRWQTQIAENAKRAAFSSRLPEADHNEVCGWERGRREAPLSAVFLQAPGGDERVARRVELTAELVAGTGAPVERVAARGETSVEHVLSLALLGDLVSVYLAALGGVDPDPIEAIERLKSALGTG
jgi:glucose/mannose-6-phosphate isomerase